MTETPNPTATADAADRWGEPVNPDKRWGENSGVWGREIVETQQSNPDGSDAP